MKVKASDNVGKLLDEHPEVLEVFLRHGFKPLANVAMRKTLAKTITVGGAAKIKGVNLDALLADLNATLGEEPDGHQGK